MTYLQRLQTFESKPWFPQLINNVLNGKYTITSYARVVNFFDWGSSPEGFDYWSYIYYSELKERDTCNNTTPAKAKALITQHYSPSKYPELYI